MAMQSAYPMPWEARKKNQGVVGPGSPASPGMTPTGALPAPIPGPMNYGKGGGVPDEDPFNPFGPSPAMPSPWDGPQIGGGYEAPPPFNPTVPGGDVMPEPPPPVAAPPPAGPPAPPTYDTSGWDTDGYAAPGFVPQGVGQYAMPGWEQSNWANPNMQTPKYGVGRILSQFDPKGGLTPEALAQIQQAYPGATFDGKDRLSIPGVGEIDVLVNAQGQGQGGDSWAWQALTGQGGAGSVPGGPGGGMPPLAPQGPLPTIPGAGGFGGGGQAPGAGGGPGGGRSWQEVMASIFNRDPNDILNNPAYLGQQKALDYQSQRERERLMNQIAERNAAQGMGDSGALAGEQNAASMGIGEAQMGMQAQLATRALEQEQSRIMQALQMAQQYGTAQEQMALQERLGQLQASLQQQSINNQYSLGQGQLGLGYHNAAQGNQQFNDQLGWNMAQWQQQQNWLPWLFGMNGQA